MVYLLESRPELREMISPGDQFFIDFFLKQYKRPDKLRVLELRRGIIAGTISDDAARAVVPRPDLARKRMKENYLRKRIENGGGEPSGGWRGVVREASM